MKTKPKKRAKPRRSREQIIAEKCVVELFRNGMFEEANTVRMYFGERYLGGWCRTAVAQVIARVLVESKSEAKA